MAARTYRYEVEFIDGAKRFGTGNIDSAHNAAGLKFEDSTKFEIHPWHQIKSIKSLKMVDSILPEDQPYLKKQLKQAV